MGQPKSSSCCASSISMRSITPTSSLSLGISQVHSSPLRAPPMSVEGKVADRLSQANLPFTALEFVRSDDGIWAHEHNAASLPLGCLSRTTWILRLQSVSIIRPMDAGNPWTWKGRTTSNSVLVRSDVAEEGNDGGFNVRASMCISTRKFTMAVRIWESCCRLPPRWTNALKLCWKLLIMTHVECGKSLASTTSLSVKLDNVVESALLWICENL